MLCIMSAHNPLVKMSPGQAQLSEAEWCCLSTGYKGSHVAMEGGGNLTGKERDSVNVKNKQTTQKDS